MPKVNLGKHDYNEEFTNKLNACVAGLGTDWKRLAPKTGVSTNTALTYKNHPVKMNMLWLKRFIKLTDLDPDVILNYLYEGKYRVERR